MRHELKLEDGVLYHFILLKSVMNGQGVMVHPSSISHIVTEEGRKTIKVFFRGDDRYAFLSNMSMEEIEDAIEKAKYTENPKATSSFSLKDIMRQKERANGC